MKDLPFTGEGAGDEMWRKFPFDTPDIFLRFELTSHTIKSGVFETWKVRYNLHEYKGAPVVSAAAAKTMNGGECPMQTQAGDHKTASQFECAIVGGTQHPKQGVTDEVRQRLLTTKAMISFKQHSDNMPCFDIIHSGISVKFPSEKKKVRASSCAPRVSTFLL